MKKPVIILLLLAMVQITYGQQIIYTISASQDGQPTHLNSILFENLNNDSRFVVGDLPVLPAYRIDLSSQLLVTGSEHVGMPAEEAFRLIRNTPGEVGVLYLGSMLENVTLSVINMAGQRMLFQYIPVLNANEVIHISIPGSGVYLLNIITNLGSVNYRAMGSTHIAHGKFDISKSIQPLQSIDVAHTDMALKSLGLKDDFSYQVGDSVRISVFLDGHFAKPAFSAIVESAQFEFEMHASDGDNKGYFTDSRDYQSYIWVKVGDQLWMAENLRYLPSVVGPGTGSATESFRYVYGYDGTDADAAKATANYLNYGVLYNWPAAMDGGASSSENPSGVQGVCPTGWHLPSDAEWTMLVNYLMNEYGYHNDWGNDKHGVGNALKSCRQVNSSVVGGCNTSEHPRWNESDTHQGFDKVGFSAFAGGFRGSNGKYDNIGGAGLWWSATEFNDADAWERGLYSHYGGVGRFRSSKSFGYSIRCIRDADTQSSYNLNLAVTPTGAGSVTGAGAYEEGAEVPLTATPNAGWTFVGWTGDTDHVADPGAALTSVTMPANDVVLTANFEEDDAGWPRDNETLVVDILNPATGRTWMDRNLGASRAATGSTDAQAYGDLYQWGRAADGHQRRTSPISVTISETDLPGHGEFIAGAWDWRSSPNDTLWLGAGGVNNPCPAGYRLPTEAEWEAERASWSSNNSAGAFSSPLKLTNAGWRGTGGVGSDWGASGRYWSQTTDGSNSRVLYFHSMDAGMILDARAIGGSVRCIKVFP